MHANGGPERLTQWVKIFIQVLFGGDNRRVLLHVLTPPLSSMPRLPGLSVYPTYLFVVIYFTKRTRGGRWRRRLRGSGRGSSSSSSSGRDGRSWEPRECPDVPADDQFHFMATFL